MKINGQTTKSILTIDSVEDGDLFDWEGIIYLKVNFYQGGLGAVDVSDGEVVFIAKGTVIDAIHPQAEITLYPKNL